MVSADESATFEAGESTRSELESYVSNTKLTKPDNKDVDNEYGSANALSEDAKFLNSIQSYIDFKNDEKRNLNDENEDLENLLITEKNLRESLEKKLKMSEERIVALTNENNSLKAEKEVQEKRKKIGLSCIRCKSDSKFVVQNFAFCSLFCVNETTKFFTSQNNGNHGNDSNLMLQ